MEILTHATVLERLGGIELCTYQLGGSLVERGHSVRLLHQVDGDMRADYEAAGVEVRGGASFAFAPRTALTDVARMLPSAWATARSRPDVLWLQRFEHVVWGQVVSRAARIPMVVHLHHVPNYRRVGLLSSGTSQFMAVSEYMRDVWTSAGLPADRVRTVLNAVPEEDYPVAGPAEQAAARARLGLPHDRFVVGHYGRLTPEKGIGVLLDAWEISGLEQREGHLLLVGEAADEAVRQRIRRLVDRGGASWFPPVNDVRDVLHASDVIAFPSLLPESFGRVVLEGLMSGKPVVASRTGAVPEILTGPLAELLVTPGDATELALALRGTLVAGAGLGDRCADHARTEFPYERHVRQVEQVLASAARVH